MRSHQSFLDDLDRIEAARTKTAREAIMKDVGINHRSIFAHLKSIDLSACFPYDIMHLLFENLVPNMIKHWTGTFKWLDQGRGNYVVAPAVWKTLGRLTTEATRTIPAAFVGTLPNIAEDPKLFKAEAHSFWFQYMAPILLKGILPQRHYNHLLLMREIIMLVLKFHITDTEIDRLQTMIHTWVTDYETLYYQHIQERLPACTTTIHALLHMAWYLRRTGPLWASWSFVMERFCGFLLPAVKNRTKPYEMLDNFVSRRAQMRILSLVFGLPPLGRPFVHIRIVNGVEISNAETMHDEFRTIVLGTPVKRGGRVAKTTQLINLLIGYFIPAYRDWTRPQIRERLDLESLISYGRFRMVPDGDRIRTADLIEGDPGARDNSYVKYDLLPDRNTAYRFREDVPYRRTYYGRLTGIYFIKFINSDGTRTPFLLASVRECNTDGRDAAMPANPVVTYDTLEPVSMIHIDTIIAVVGILAMGQTWAIVDRSRENVRPQFNDDDGGNDYD